MNGLMGLPQTGNQVVRVCELSGVIENIIHRDGVDVVYAKQSLSFNLPSLDAQVTTAITNDDVIPLPFPFVRLVEALVQISL